MKIGIFFNVRINLYCTFEKIYGEIVKLKLEMVNIAASKNSYRISSNKRRASNKRRTPKCSAYWNSYNILLVGKPKCIWNWYANNKTTKIMLKFRFFHYIWFFDSENLCFILILKRKNEKVLIFNIVHFPNFKISASL